MRFTRREWAIQRMAWSFWGVVVLAALLGLFGRGPLSRAVAGAEGLRVEYDRLARHGGDDRMRITVLPPGSGGGVVRVWMTRAFADAIEIQWITPRPESVSSSAERLTYVFRASELARPAVITFRFRHDEYWRQRLQIGLVGGASVDATQFVFP